MTTAQLAQHIADEVEALGADRVRVDSWFQSACQVTPWSTTLYLPEIDGVDAYWIALHELGHAHQPPCDWLTYEENLLADEADAWQWALAHSLVPPTPRMWAQVYGGLSAHRGQAFRAYPCDDFASLIQRAAVAMDEDAFQEFNRTAVEVFGLAPAA